MRYAANPEKAQEKTRKWRQANPDKMRASSRQSTIARRYGLTVQEYEAYLFTPCAICGNPSEALDHNHDTGRIRAGLCKPCNSGLGDFKDSPAQLERAARYLRIFGFTGEDRSE